MFDKDELFKHIGAERLQALRDAAQSDQHRTTLLQQVNLPDWLSDILSNKELEQIIGRREWLNEHREG